MDQKSMRDRGAPTEQSPTFEAIRQPTKTPVSQHVLIFLWKLAVSGSLLFVVATVMEIREATRPWVIPWVLAAVSSCGLVWFMMESSVIDWLFFCGPGWIRFCSFVIAVLIGMTGWLLMLPSLISVWTSTFRSAWIGDFP
jgi:hypothetical protein